MATNNNMSYVNICLSNELSAIQKKMDKYLDFCELSLSIKKAAKYIIVFGFAMTFSTCIVMGIMPVYMAKLTLLSFTGIGILALLVSNKLLAVKEREILKKIWDFDCKYKSEIMSELKNQNINISKEKLVYNGLLNLFDKTMSLFIATFKKHKIIKCISFEMSGENSQTKKTIFKVTNNVYNEPKNIVEAHSWLNFTSFYVILILLLSENEKHISGKESV